MGGLGNQVGSKCNKFVVKYTVRSKIRMKTELPCGNSDRSSEGGTVCSDKVGVQSYIEAEIGVGRRWAIVRSRRL